MLQISARDEEGGNGQALWICRDERLAKHPRGREAPWICNDYTKNRSAKHKRDWERDGPGERRGEGGGLLRRTGGRVPAVEGAAAVPTPFSFFPRPWTSNRYAGRQGIKMSSDTKREGSKMLGGRARRVEYFTTLDRVSICECTGRPNN